MLSFQRLLMVTLMLVIAGFLSKVVEAEDPVKLPTKEQFHLFLLVGQSNMAGRGKVTDADKIPHPRVLMLTKDGTWAPAVDPLHFDKPKVIGVGLGRAFAMDLAESEPDVTIGLIPCAVGGSPIAAWEPGVHYSPTNSHPWDDALRRAKLAMKDGTLKGILWHQGESDSKPEKADVYEQKLHDLIARFRRELNAETVPFLVGQLGQFPDRPWTEERKQVDAAQRNLPHSVDHTAYVSSEGLTHKGDQVHFDADSYRELGRRYANAYRQVTDQ